MSIKSKCKDKDTYKQTLNEIAKRVSELDYSDVPDDDYYEACQLVSRDLYGADDVEAIMIASIIQKKCYYKW